MKKLITFFMLVGVVISAYVLGTWRGQRQSAPDQTAGARKILYYVDPMNPAHTSSQPGLAPCGMKMEPVYADETARSVGAPSSSLLPGTVRIIPEKQQLIGVRLGLVERKPLVHTLRLLGKVAADDTRIYRLNATVDGWITKALPFASGSRVKKNETLATFYSPEFLSAGQALLFALNSKDRAQAAGSSSSENLAVTSRVAQFNINLQQYRDSLRNLGMGDLQIEDMIQTRKFTPNVNLVSPTDGFVITRTLSEGQRFEKGTELFRITDLGHVWILADVFAKEAGLISSAVAAKVKLPGDSRVFTAALSDALPQFDGTSRTLKLRFEAENPEFVLKPDMFVDVEIPVSLAETLVVPVDAVLDAGLRQTVFVDRGHGFFEPRPVQVGVRLGDQVQIVAGLTNGERIVISGNFLLDSESRMKLAAASVPDADARDPVCGMAVDEAQARIDHYVSDHLGKTYFFCSDGCKKGFDATPGKYLEPWETNQPTSAASAGASAVSTNSPSHRDPPHH
jgi:membrane fusion protein, copper/silver efflux system